jgi:NAD(P)-dependent dehydrogenase (short-subunit alcohol dehydrogenase family)
MDGRILLATGAAQGIGLATALEAARNGAEAILLTDRSAERGQDAAAQVRAAGGRAEFFAADLNAEAAPAAIMGACVQHFGRVDALINAAGLTDRGSVANATTDLWDKLFAVNARAPFFLMQGVINHLRERKAPGAIVNILSMNAHGGSPELAVYSATKGALSTATRNAAQAHRFDRIRINGINVGWADTPAERHMQAEILGGGEHWLERAAAAQPFGRLLSPEDVARLAIFLLSDASIPMTGALIDQEQSVLGTKG